MTELLQQYLRELATRKFEHGQCDCALALADWVERATGIDVAGEYRGAYDTPQQWRRLVVRAGGLAGLVGPLAARAGWLPVEDPREGDIGVVVMPKVGATGAIYAGRRWVLKMAGGLVGVRDVAVIRAWGMR